MKLREVHFVSPIQLPGSDRYSSKSEAHGPDHPLVTKRNLPSFDIEADLGNRVVIVSKGDERHMYPFEFVKLMIPEPVKPAAAADQQKRVISDATVRRVTKE